ncbi:CAP domain-containing protein [Anaerobacillus sp. MEB173]|uniref:CAP domain-containing protein n=1 Tax=Anaerobacillus sp. MEB173 TaxID=3383345 RepID=UPI003F8FBCB8
MKKFGCLLLLLGLITIFFFNDQIENQFLNEIEKIDELSDGELLSEEKTDTSIEYRQDGYFASMELYDFIGDSIEGIITTFGQPDRIDPSAYGYDWYIYAEHINSYFQVGVKNGEVQTVFVIGEKLPNERFQIGDSFEQIEENEIIEEKVSFTFNKNSYRFELTEDERIARPLIPIKEGVWAQLYFDTFTNEISSIRYLNSELLLMKRPYSVVYRGELYEPEPLTAEQWRQIERGSAKQIFDITNVIRVRHGLEPFQWDEKTATVAYKHSKDMFVNDYFSHTSPQFGELSDRFNSEDIRYHMAGENIAAKYVDGIAAVEGWLNSEGHRVNLLNEEFTHLGVGVYETYYTQNFFTPFP